MEEIRQTIPIDLLDDNCYYKVEEEIKHVYLPEELKNLKFELFEIAKYRSHRSRVLAKVTELMKDQHSEESVVEQFLKIPLEGIGDVGIKQLNKNFDTMLAGINQGYEIRKQMVYGFDYQDLGKMAVYDADGNLLYERPLYPNERQTKITSMIAN